jgi:hypothetical protein
VLGLGLGMGCLMIVLSIIVAIYGHERLLSLLVWFAIGAAATVIATVRNGNLFIRLPFGSGFLV